MLNKTSLPQCNVTKSAKKKPVIHSNVIQSTVRLFALVKALLFDPILALLVGVQENKGIHMSWVQTCSLTGHRVPSQGENTLTRGACSRDSQVDSGQLCQAEKLLLLVGLPLQGVARGGDVGQMEIFFYLLWKSAPSPFFSLV